MNETKYYAGLDIGGSTIKAMLIDGSGQQAGDLVEKRSLVHEGYQRTFAQLNKAVTALLENNSLGPDNLAGVGVDVPAASSNGVIWARANLGEDWPGVNIREEFSRFLGKPVFMTNDGSAAAYGEYALRPDLQSGLLLVAPGTGLGGGLILPGGQIYEGANGLALEIGHISVPFHEEGELPPCSCGRKGCVEAWVSLVAIRRQLKIELAKDEHADHPLNQGDISIYDKAFRLRDLAEEGDALAVEIFRKQAYILGYALGDQAHELDPGLIVFGGGLAETKFRDKYLEDVKEGFAERAWPIYLNSPIPPHVETTRFEWATGGDSAAALGVALKAREMILE